MDSKGDVSKDDVSKDGDAEAVSLELEALSSIMGDEAFRILGRDDAEGARVEVRREPCFFLFALIIRDGSLLRLPSTLSTSTPPKNDLTPSQ